MSVNNNTKIQTGIGPMTDTLLNNMADKLTNREFKEIVASKIVDPVTEIFYVKVKPYFYGGILLYAIIIILLLLILYRQNKK
jgi:hypothetical protein